MAKIARIFEGGTMTSVISIETAANVWRAHREIETGKKMLAELREKIKNRVDPNPIDAFGRRQLYKLGVPHGESGHELLDVSPELALHIIEAHISRKQTELVEHCVRATLELSGEVFAKAEGR
jgi:hypothetical protein